MQISRRKPVSLFFSIFTIESSCVGSNRGQARHQSFLRSQSSFFFLFHRFYSFRLLYAFTPCQQKWWGNAASGSGKGGKCAMRLEFTLFPNAVRHQLSVVRAALCCHRSLYSRRHVFYPSCWLLQWPGKKEKLVLRWKLEEFGVIQTFASNTLSTLSPQRKISVVFLF